MMMMMINFWGVAVHCPYAGRFFSNVKCMNASGERWFGWCYKVTDLQSTRIIRMIKSRRMTLTRHVARKEEKRNARKILMEKLEERDVGRRIILK